MITLGDLPLEKIKMRVKSVIVTITRSDVTSMPQSMKLVVKFQVVFVMSACTIQWERIVKIVNYTFTVTTLDPSRILKFASVRNFY